MMTYTIGLILIPNQHYFIDDPLGNFYLENELKHKQFYNNNSV